MEKINLENLVSLCGHKTPDRGSEGEVSFSELNVGGRIIRLKNHKHTFVFSPLNFSTIPSIHIGDYLIGYYCVENSGEINLIAYQLSDKKGGRILERGFAKGYCLKNGTS